MKLRAIVGAAAIVALALTGQVSAVVAPPQGVTAIALDGRVEIAWRLVPGATSYNVYRGTSPTQITTAVTPPGGTAGTALTDTSAANGTTYYYATRSSDDTESASSLAVRATPRARSCSTGNPVVLENCFPGDAGWTIAGPSGIEGFATASSIAKGESVDLKVNLTAAATFRVEIYRTGYYGGAGARLFSTIEGIPGVQQPACQRQDTTTGLIDCSNWSVSATITTTASWPSGVYMVRLVRSGTNADNHVLFVVRDDARSAEVLYGVAFTDFAAYNNWGGKSLYDWNSSGSTTVAGTARAVKVSFDRPFAQPRQGLRDWYSYIEHPLVSWLEQSGYDVAYQSNTDMERNGARVRDHELYVLPAHDEYYSGAMRTALTQARDAGIDLFSSGGNDVYWKIRFENSPYSGGQDRVQVCYKSTQSGGPDPSGIPTTTWRDPAGANNPENALLGSMYVGDNDFGYFPLTVPAADGRDRLWRYTSLDAQAPGTSTNIGQSLVGWEWNSRATNGFEPAGVKTLASTAASGELVQNNGRNYTPGSATVHVVKYRAASGALVVAVGTNHWNRGLARNAFGEGEPTVEIQQMTTNVLADMGAIPQTPASTITADDPAGRRIAAPAGVQAQAISGQAITVSWGPATGAQAYNVYRTTAARVAWVPMGTRVNGGTLTGTSFTDTSLAASTTYYYVVTAVSGSIHSAPSAEVQATTTAGGGGGTTVRINTGGGAYTTGSGATFSADTNFTGGFTYSDTLAVAGTTEDPLYQSERWGAWTYSIPVPNGSYDVLLHFVELYYAAPCAGKRIFSVDVLDTAAVNDVLNLDICAQVGARTALVRPITNVTVSDGRLDLRAVYGAADDPEIAAIEVVPAGAPPPDTTPPSVSVTAPASGATVSTTATVSANASDNVGVTGVQFKLNGANLGAEDTQAPYSLAWDTTTASNGSHTLTAVARDAAGNTTPSAAVPVTVDNAPPTAPGTLSATGSQGAVALNWSPATDNVGVLRYNVHRSTTAGFTPTAGNRVAQPTGTSYGDSGLAVGTHYYRVTAEDAAGNVGPPSNQASATVPDTTFPSVSVTGPSGGAAVRVTITVTATASDDVGVAGVQFRLDGLVLGAEDTSVPYSIPWDTTGATNGTHVLTATARDAAGNATPSADVSVTVDNAAPSASITVPAAGATVSGTTTVSANASDNAGVVGVQFRLDGANLGAEDTSAPFSVAWNTTGATNGPHSLTAVARDAAGNSTTSAAVSVTVQNSTSGLVAAYGFNEASGTTVTDASGNGNTGTISGATRTSAGRFGSALSFDGVNDWVTVADAPTLDLTRMTLEAWVYPTALSDWQTILIKEQAGDLVYALYANTGFPGTANRPSGHIFAGADFDTRGTAQLALNTWTHLAATWDGVTLRLYVNGSQVSTRAVGGSMPNSSGPLHFGGNAVWGEWFSGRLDEIRVYSRALSASEIQADMSRAVT